MADEMVPDTIEGIRGALTEHMAQNRENFAVMKSSVDALWDMTRNIQKEEQQEKGEKMAAETINVGSGTDNAAMMMAALSGRGGSGGLFGGGDGGGVIGGLILGSLLRNNGNLFGGGDGAGAAGAMLRSPPEQSQANMDLMAAIGGVDKAVAVSTAAMEASQANQTIGLTSQFNNITSSLASRIDGVKEAVNAGTMVLAQQLNGVSQSIMENRYELSKDISTDGDKTRALITQQYEATLNRQLSEANNALAELRTDARIAERSRGVEVTTTNNINQLQQQQQQQTQWTHLAGLVSNLANDLQYIRATNQAINVGSGTLTANPANTNTNIR
jgi:hypothetical protein